MLLIFYLILSHVLSIWQNVLNVFANASFKYYANYHCMDKKCTSVIPEDNYILRIQWELRKYICKLILFKTAIHAAPMALLN